MIYVDDRRNIANSKFNGYCHMWTDGTHEELDTFAQSIGLKKEWAQQKQGAVIKDFYHYDIAPSYRLRALHAGAIHMPLYTYVKRYQAMQLSEKGSTMDEKKYNLNQPPHLVAGQVIRDIEAIAMVKFGSESSGCIIRLVEQYQNLLLETEQKIAGELTDELRCMKRG